MSGFENDQYLADLPKAHPTSSSNNMRVTSNLGETINFQFWLTKSFNPFTSTIAGPFEELTKEKWQEKL